MARILLVDDEKMARTLYGDYLRAPATPSPPWGTSTRSARPSRPTPYDAVVTDLILPGADGMEVLRYTKERYPGIEVVVITGLDKVDPAVRAIKSGAAEYLVKPVAPEALQHAVRRALTTRDLLRENASLRQYVSLLEMGQRIATTLDRERLAIAVSSALEAQTLAGGVLLLLHDGGPAAAPRLRAALEPSSGGRARAPAHRAAAGHPHAPDPGGAAREPPGTCSPSRPPTGTCRSGRSSCFFSSPPPENVRRGGRIPRRATTPWRCATWGASPRWRIWPTWTISPTSTTCATCTWCWTGR